MKLRRVSALVFAFLAFSGSIAAAQELTMKDYDFKPGRGYSYVFATAEYMTLIYLPTMKSIGQVRQAWFYRIFSKPQSLAGFSFDRSAEKMEIDCQRERHRLVAQVLYSGGRHVHSEENVSEWRPIVPDTRASTNMKAACDPASLNGEGELDALAAKYLENSRKPR